MTLFVITISFSLHSYLTMDLICNALIRVVITHLRNLCNKMIIRKQPLSCWGYKGPFPCFSHIKNDIDTNVNISPSLNYCEKRFMLKLWSPKYFGALEQRRKSYFFVKINLLEMIAETWCVTKELSIYFFKTK